MSGQQLQQILIWYFETPLPSLKAFTPEGMPGKAAITLPITCL